MTAFVEMGKIEEKETNKETPIPVFFVFLNFKDCFIRGELSSAENEKKKQMTESKQNKASERSSRHLKMIKKAPQPQNKDPKIYMQNINQTPLCCHF
jgi:hypothetical protein